MTGAQAIVAQCNALLEGTSSTPPVDTKKMYAGKAYKAIQHSQGDWAGNIKDDAIMQALVGSS